MSDTLGAGVPGLGKGFSPSPEPFALGPGSLAASVVVPVLNRPDGIATLVEALRNQDLAHEEWELIVVDNGSTDGTWEYLQSLTEGWIRVVREQNRGPSAARNHGIRQTRGRILAFIDSDCVPRRGWLSGLISALGNSPHWAVGGLLHSAPPTTLIEAFTMRQNILDQRDFLAPGPYKPPFLLTANFAARREAIERVGPFDEELRVGEDADFCWRLLQHGGTLGLAREAIAEHQHRSSFPAFARQMFTYGKGSATLFARYRNFIGRSHWIDWTGYRDLALAVLKTPICILSREPYRRWQYPLEILRYSCFICGRIAGSLENRVLAI